MDGLRRGDNGDEDPIDGGVKIANKRSGHIEADPLGFRIRSYTRRLAVPMMNGTRIRIKLLEASAADSIWNEEPIHGMSARSGSRAHGSPGSNSKDDDELVWNDDAEDNRRQEDIDRLLIHDKVKTADYTRFDKGKQIDDGASTMLVEHWRDPISDSSHVCELCGRSFFSVKSLHGHMRFHSDRSWRGMSRPPGGRINCSSPNDGPSMHGIDLLIDQALLVLKWSPTAKRGRKVTKPHYETNSRMPENVAANTLLLMKYESSLGAENFVQLAANQFGGSKRSLHLNDSINAKDESGIERAIDRPEHQDSSTGGIEARNDEYREIASHSSVLSRESKKRKIEYWDDPRDANEIALDREYRCITCNKCFSSHQALGGHRASHNKLKINPENSEMLVETKDANTIGKERINSNIEQSKTAATEHKCKICHLAFPTGQALGGHMRRHWTGQENRSIVPQAPTTESGRGNRLELDLNELPKWDGQDSQEDA